MAWIKFQLPVEDCEGAVTMFYAFVRWYGRICVMDDFARLVEITEHCQGRPSHFYALQLKFDRALTLYHFAQFESDWKNGMYVNEAPQIERGAA